MNKLEKLRKKWRTERFLRDEAIEYIKKIRFELARRTFPDLDNPTNPYFKNLRGRERRFKQRFRQQERKLNKIDEKIEQEIRKSLGK